VELERYIDGVGVGVRVEFLQIGVELQGVGVELEWDTVKRGGVKVELELDMVGVAQH
jgi:hypothetical protein